MFSSYALLTHLIAHECNFKVGEFIHPIGDLTREPRVFPMLKISPEKKSIFDIELEDLIIEGYEPHPAIKAPIAV